MKVKAIATGYFGNRRIKPGQVFEIKDLKVKKQVIDPKTKQKVEKTITITAQEQFSDVWMVELDKVEAKSTAVDVKPFDYEDNVKAVDSKEEEPVI